MITVLTAARLLSPTEVIDSPVVFVEDGVITRIHSGDSEPIPAGARHIDFPDATLAPAFIDIHVHGGAGHDLMDTTDISAIGRFLATRGVGAYFPTTVTASIDSTLRTLDRIATHIEHAAASPSNTAAATPVAIHLEGPFLSHDKRGVHPPELLQTPSIELFTRFWQAARGHIGILTIAPELPDAIGLIAHAVSLGVRVSLGHSNADTAAAKAGFDAGARSTTHTFNAMRKLDHRDPGILGLALDPACAQRGLYSEIIADGVHVHPSLVRLFLRAKGPDHAILVTDGISATGMPDGRYHLGPLSVEVKDGVCLLDGTLAGSVLTMDRALRNCIDFTGCDLSIASRLASANPAALTGISSTHGSIDVGRRADIAVLSSANELITTFISGISTQS